MVRDFLKLRRHSSDQGSDAKVLSLQQHELLAEETLLLDRLASILATYPATADDLRQVEEAKTQLSDLFLLVVAGEFNSGKSAFINALIGEAVMPEGVTPTTSMINLLRSGDKPGSRMLPSGIVERSHPAALLDEITIVDTPGTNAIIREHEELTQRFVPRSDIVFFVTSADRPFTESEREFMEEIREWGKKVVVVVNKRDLVRSQEDVATITDFVSANIERLLGFRPEVFAVSALQAQQANELAARNPEEAQRLWDESEFGSLENFIFSTLDEEGRIRLKLLSPLGTADHLVEQYLAATRERLQILDEDMRTIENIERQLELYQEDMRRQFAFHLSRIEAIIARMTARGDDFFEETVRLGRVFDLWNTDKIRASFDEQVVGDSERDIDAAIDELIDWMVEQDLRTWESINGYLDRRRLAQYEDEMVGEMSSQFRYDRRALIDSVSTRAREEVDRYDPEAAGRELSESVRSAVAQVAVTEAGAVGLGALVVAAASTVAVDVTGILAASLIAGLGLFILPRKRKQAREEFRKRSAELESRLIEVMSAQFESELTRSSMRMESAIAPYTRFVRDQRDRLTRFETELVDLQGDLRRLRFAIGDPDQTADLTLRQ